MPHWAEERHRRESNYVALEAGLDEGESIRRSEHSRSVAVLMLGAGVAVADPDAAPGDPGGPGAPGAQRDPSTRRQLTCWRRHPTRWRCRRHLTRWRRRHLTRSRRPRLTRWQCR